MSSALAQPFLGLIGIVGVMQGGGESSPVEPGSMLWLIQRDFLEGKTVQTMVSEALQPVPNPYNDQDIAQVHNAWLAVCAVSCRDPCSCSQAQMEIFLLACCVRCYLRQGCWSKLSEDHKCVIYCCPSIHCRCLLNCSLTCLQCRAECLLSLSMCINWHCMDWHAA